MRYLAGTLFSMIFFSPRVQVGTVNFIRMPAHRMEVCQMGADLTRAPVSSPRSQL